MQTRLVFAAFLFAGLAAGCTDELAPGPEGEDDIVESNLGADETLVSTGGKEDSLNTTATYYRVEQDTRKCAYPECGGWWVNRVNRSWTQCHDGVWRERCYVVDVDLAWGGFAESESDAVNQSMRAKQVVLRGRFVTRIFSGKRKGQFKPTEVWSAGSAVAPTGTFYKVTNKQLVCIYSPCPSFHQAMLNSTISQEIHELNFDRVGDETIANSAWVELDSGPILAAGTNSTFTASLGGGKGTSLDATQFYIRVRPEGLASYAPTAREIGGQSFSDPTSAKPPYPRTYRYDYSTWNVVVEDAVSPCPAGATCIWSGIVSRSATWSVSADRVKLVWTSPSTQGDGFSIKYYGELAVKKDRAGKLVLVEIQDDGQGTDRRFRQPGSAE